MKEFRSRADIVFSVRKKTGKMYEKKDPEDLALKIKSDILESNFENKLPNRAQLTMIYRADLRALQGAFNLLEDEGLVRTVNRKGTFINNEVADAMKKDSIN